MEVQASSAELNLIDAKNNLDLARINFNKVIGIDLSTTSDIITPIIDSDRISYNPDKLISEALQQRDELKSIEFRVKELLQQVQTGIRMFLCLEIFITTGQTSVTSLLKMSLMIRGMPV